MGTIATGQQTRQKDCYAPSERVKCVLRTNGEMKTSVVVAGGGPPVQAGFDAPTVAPSGSVGGGGSLSGYYVYAYAYASTKYPYVENAVTTGDGELWPRSNPSPMSSVQDCSAGSKTVTLTITKTTRSDVDKIVVYRTQTAATSAAAQALADAGTLYYIATVANNGVAGTVVVADTGLTDTGEELELDNYVAPTAEFCVFDGTYWWTAGNPVYTADVTLDGTSTVAVTGDNLFDGRNGQFVTFNGVSMGGFDGIGTFYGKITGTATVVLYEDTDLTTPLAVNFTGTTQMQIRGFNNILWRSKPFNPFSWGITEAIATDGGDGETDVPELFALNLGGGSVTAMIVAPTVKRLIIHFENPQQTIALDLTFADASNFGLTQQVLDSTSSVTAHFTLFHGMIGDVPMILGIDTYNGDVLACDGNSQKAIADNFGTFIQSLPKPERSNKFFCGQYDPGTQLNCFWMRNYTTTEHNNIMLWVHGPTGFCGWTPDPFILSATTLIDSVTNERLVLGGTDTGFLGWLLCPEQYTSWNLGVGWDTGILTTPGTILLAWNAQFGDTQVFITQTSPTTGVFSVSSLNVVVGQEIVLRLDTDNSLLTYTVTEILQTSVSTWQITLDSAYPATGDNYTISAHPKYYGRTWWVYTNAVNAGPGVPPISPTQIIFIKSAFDSFSNDRPLLNLEYGLSLGADDIELLVFTLLDMNTSLYFGGQPIAFRSYFNLNQPTLNKKADQVWMTLDQQGGDTYTDMDYTGPSARFYIQYGDTVSGTFGLTRLDSVAEITSIVFQNGTEVPSYQPKSLGFEFMQVSQNPAIFYDYTIKVMETSP